MIHDSQEATGASEDPPAGDTALLVARAKTGDGRALEDLVARFSSAIRKQLGGKLPNYLYARLDTGDLMQSFWMRVQGALPAFQYLGTGSLDRWLFRLAATSYIDNLREQFADRRDARRDVPLPDSDDPEVEGFACKSASPLQSAAREELREKAFRILDGMDGVHREAALLAIFGQCEPGAVAVLLSISPKAATRWIAKAVSQLERKLGSIEGLES